MGTNATDSHHLQFKQSESTYRIDNLCNLTSELLTDARLPQELIIEILLRLPVKSLLKFKCVSKSWLSLISSPQFVRSHFSISSEADRYLNSQVLITTKPSTSLFTTLPPTPGIKQFSLYSALYEEPSSYVSDVEYPSQKPFDDPSIAGIINGLVCLVIRGSFFLWNPVLRNYKHLPTSNVTRKDFAFFAYGFGYDDSNDDYKVVVLVSDNYLLGSDNVAVYSLLTDSWRRIEDFKSRLPFDFSGKYADGKIHWIVGSSACDCWKIVSLDMVSEKFGELQLPECEDGVSRTVFGVSGGQLSVLCNYHLKKVDLWVMDKYGVQESWSKVVSIPYDNLHPAKSNMYSYLPQVVCILRNGEIVLSDGSDLLVYNSKHKEYRNIELGGCGRCKIHVYVESLVSPNGLHSSDVISVV